MAIRTVTFSATASGVTPASPQSAGVQGEHNATNVIINLSAELVSALSVDGAVYRFEFVDANDGFDTTENFALVSPATSVEVLLPNGWTSAAGCATLRLVIAQLGIDNSEEMTLFSLPCRLKISDRYTGTGATQTIDCGFAGGARFVLIKRTDDVGDWYVWDSARGMVSGTDPSLLLNSTAGEVNANSVYTITTGFQIVSTASGINASGGSYIFLAIA